ncbi:sodium:proton antiporter [Parabacteroides sp. OttesenSCG-928-N08]|nr:sodium:proton antiporter [Parabacteroides sp. OttesenSCG-928-N08]
MKEKPRPLPPLGLSLIPVLVLVVLLFLTIRIFGSDALSGGSQIILLTSTAICSFIAILFCGAQWKEIESSIANNIFGVSTAMLILLMVGALAGSWMISGVVPTLIYYGLKILHPTFFLPACCVICALVSVMTGSSWTTIATIGIALLGIGEAQGFPVGWVAGAIISGAYFGDKVSPLSDTTVLAASITSTPLFTHIRYLMYTTIPSLILSLILFTIAGFVIETTDAAHIANFSSLLTERFVISPWLLIVPVATGILIAKKLPSIITLFLSAALAGLFALLFQPALLHEIAGPEGGLFKGLLITYYGATALETGNAALNDLVATRGMAGMMNTIWLILCAMCFGGAMTGTRMLQSITGSLITFMKNRVSMVGTTVVSGIFLNIFTADQYISIILSAEMYKDIYKKKGFESRLLSRTIEDSVTVTSVLIPWNTCGMTQATVLGVSTWTYLPYCFFNLLSPLVSVLVAISGYKIKQLITDNEKD